VFVGVTIGYSDHTRPEFSSMAIQTAFSLGARVFEKHFTLDKTLKGNDHYHSFNADDCARIISSLQILDKMKNYSEVNFLTIQSDARNFARRGLYARTSVRKGESISKNHIISLRPRFEPNGVPAEELFNTLGRVLLKDLLVGEPLTIEHLE
jgi:N-acetylneuraminate synthase